MSLTIVSFGVLRADVFPVSSAAQIATAMQSAGPGDTLIMSNGTWTDQLIVFAGAGDSTNAIVLRAETPGQVIVTGSSYLRIAGSWLVVDGLRFEGGVSPSGAVIEFRGNGVESDHCRLTQTSIANYNPPDINTDYKWVSLYGHHNRVDNCYFVNKTHSGTTLVVWLGPQPNYHRIDRNYFGPRPALGFNGGETIRVGTSDWSMYDSYTVVEENYFYQCDGEVEIISSKSCENIYRANTFVSCGGALTLRHGNRCTVEGNFFLGNKVANSGGIRVIGEDHRVYNNYLADLYGSSTKSALPIMNGVPSSPLNRYFQVQRAIIAFNTVVDCKYPLLVGVGKDAELSLPPKDVVFANNIVRSTTGTMIQYIDTPINLTYEGNIFYGASLGITQPPGITIVDPQLAKGSEGLWRPGGSSPAQDSAKGSFAFIIQDMDGQSRVDPKDVGADEWAVEEISRRPLTPEDVGPLWMRPSTSAGNDGMSIPHGLTLQPNYPNPFNPATTIRFTLPERGRVTLQVIDMSGRLVGIILDEVLEAGAHQKIYRAGALSSGTYLVRLSTHHGSITRKVVLLK